MRNIKEIISDLRSTLEWSQPNIKYNDFLHLINELELTQSTLNEVEESVKIEETPKLETTTKKSTKIEN